MKKVWCIACLIGIMATAQAQERSERLKDPTERAERQTTALTKALDLTEEQQASVSEINLKYAEEVNGLWEENRESREKTRAAMKEMKQRKDAELQEVLTEEQMKEYQEFLEKRRDRRGKRRRG